MPAEQDPQHTEQYPHDYRAVSTCLQSSIHMPPCILSSIPMTTEQYPHAYRAGDQRGTKRQLDTAAPPAKATAPPTKARPSLFSSAQPKSTMSRRAKAKSQGDEGAGAAAGGLLGDTAGETGGQISRTA
ncbi:hypothetical protein HaLaN_16686 [Haematococcus lacustris]|uniref:Uncharacterized protein n=1 Tax=Haematococcus lacustris TaxID=44745 RepID=A0A699ZLA2_HAELA|nr:hypothetical protein HaLaN_16686 [Haematococcus lacustris]